MLIDLSYLKRLKNRDRRLSAFLLVSLLTGLVYPFVQPGNANATVTQTFVRFDRLATGSAVSGSACLETSTVGTETAVTIVFPSDWTISGTAGNWTVTTTNLPADPSDGSAANAWPGIDTATSVNGLSVTFPSTDLTVDTFYCFNFAGAASTVGAAGNDKTGQIKTEGGAPYVDSIDWATSVVSSGADQITVTASISATMTFSLSGNTADLGTLSTDSVTSDGGITQTVSTNARNGWVSWVKSANSGLDSATAADSIDSPGSFNGTPESLAAQAGYVLDVNTGTNTPTINDEYNGADTSSGGFLDTQFRETALATDPADGDTVTLVVRAKAGATNAAASDYTDTLTVVAAGSF